MGPNPLTGPVAPSGFQYFTGPAPWAGRVTAIATHPTDANTAYIGAAIGGVWKTVNGGSTWTPLFDNQASLAIGSIAVSATNPQEIFVGTGEANSVSFDTSDSYYGAGVYVSTNGGASWTHVAEPRFDGCHIGAIQVSPSNASVIDVAAASNGGRAGPGIAGQCVPGIYRSVDGGATWTVALNTVTDKEYPALDFAVDPSAPTIWYAGLEFAGVYRSLDSGATWSRLTTGLPAVASVGRVVVSAAGSTGVYAAIATPESALQGVYASANSGTSWSQVTSANFCAGAGGGPQCEYDFAVAANPAAPTVFYTGGVTMRRFASSGDTSSAILDPYGVAGASGVHWDVHALEFDANARLWIGTDGGVWRTSDGGATVQNLNAGLSLQQFYPGISGSANGPLLGGMQDNASAEFDGTLSWLQKGYGDGGGTAVDPTTNPATRLVTSYSGSVLRSSDGGNTWADDQNAGIVIQDGNHEFITPFEMGGGTPRRLYNATNVVYRSTNRAASWQAISPVFAAAHTNGGGRVTAIAEGISSGGSVIYAGTHDGQLRVTTNGGSTWPDTNGSTSPVPWRYITDFAVDPTSALDAFVSVSGFDGAGAGNSGHVFHTTNGGGTWVAASGSGGGALPNSPVSAIAMDRVNSPHRLFAGTDVGVFVSTDNGANWSRYGQGLPNTAVVDLLVDTTAGKLVAATHGRGMFVAEIAPPPGNDSFATPSLLTGTAGSIAATTAGATSETGEPAHGGGAPNSGGSSIWYSWTPQASGTVTIDTVGSGAGVDTLLDVFTGNSLGGLSLIAGNDDITGQTGGPSRVTFEASAGQTYRITVDGWNGGVLPSSGPIKLNWSQPDVPDAVADGYSVQSPGPLEVAAPGVLGNDVNVGTGTAKATGAGAQHGTVTLDPDGAFTYTPTGGFVGADTFHYCIAENATCKSGAATVTITVESGDDQPPTVSIDSHPPATTSAAAASFEFSGGDAGSPPVTFTCALDGAQAAPCSSPKNYPALADGQHSFAVQAHDGAGNVSPPKTWTWRIDTHAPSAHLTGPSSAVSLASTARITWTGSDASGSGIAYYQLRYKRAHYNTGFGAWTTPAGWQVLSSTARTQTGIATGDDYCWSVRAGDYAGNTSAWSAQRCRARPLDDRSLTASRGWTRAGGRGYWNGTVTTAAAKGAQLTIRGGRLSRVGIVATRCPGCGRVGIFVNGVRIGTLDLAAPRTANRRLLLLPAFAYRTGTVSIRIISAGRPVRIDGIVVSRT
jgi:photosystem II stability/assembly factor-like uncharacterized protein